MLLETGFTTDVLRQQLAKHGVPLNDAASVAKAIVYLGVNESASGQIIYVADDKFTELEGPIRKLRPQWLREENSRWLEPVFDMKS